MFEEKKERKRNEASGAGFSTYFDKRRKEASERLVTEREGESPRAFRRVYARQIGPVLEAKTAQTSQVLQCLSQARRVWGSGPDHQCHQLTLNYGKKENISQFANSFLY